MTKQKRISFEIALKRLEEIVSSLDSQELSLEDALKSYEEGVKLTRYCSRILNEAEKKIEILKKDGGGDLTVEPFLPGESDVEDKPVERRPQKEESKPEEQLLF